MPNYENSAFIKIEIDDGEVEGLNYGEYEFDVVYYSTPYIPACTTGNPSNWSPEEGGDFEILSATLEDGRELFDVYKGNLDRLAKIIESEIKESWRHRL